MLICFAQVLTDLISLTVKSVWLVSSGHCYSALERISYALLSCTIKNNQISVFVSLTYYIAVICTSCLAVNYLVFKGNMQKAACSAQPNVQC